MILSWLQGERLVKLVRVSYAKHRFSLSRLQSAHCKQVLNFFYHFLCGVMILLKAKRFSFHLHFSFSVLHYKYYHPLKSTLMSFVTSYIMYWFQVQKCGHICRAWWEKVLDFHVLQNCKMILIFKIQYSCVLLKVSWWPHWNQDLQ